MNTMVNIYNVKYKFFICIILKLCYIKNKGEYNMGYLTDIIKNNNEILSKDEQIALVNKFQKTGDITCINKLIKHNIKYVYTVAKRYRSSITDIDDLISVGCIGIIEAAKRFNGERDSSFINYASWWVKLAIKNELVHLQTTVSIPVGIWYKLKKIKMLKSNGISDYEISKICNCSMFTVKYLANYYEYRLDKKSDYQDDGNDICYEIIGTEDIEYVDDLKNHLLNIINNLNKQQSDIIKMRFGLCGYEPHTLSAIGDIYGLTRERIRQIESIALKILKDNLGNDNKNKR